MSDSNLRDQIAAALIARIKAATVSSSELQIGGSIGHFLAATEHDLADVALAVVSQHDHAEAVRLHAELAARDAEIARLRAELAGAEEDTAEQHQNALHWQERAEQAEAEWDRLRDQIKRVQEKAEAALAAWKPEHEYYQDRAERKGYSHDETAAETYGLAIEAVTAILAALDQPESGQ